jgi:hypothetical protein
LFLVEGGAAISVASTGERARERGPFQFVVVKSPARFSMDIKKEFV